VGYAVTNGHDGAVQPQHGIMDNLGETHERRQRRDVKLGPTTVEQCVCLQCVCLLTLSVS
jgi:hypothetical protein